MLLTVHTALTLTCFPLVSSMRPLFAGASDAVSSRGCHEIDTRVCRFGLALTVC